MFSYCAGIIYDVIIEPPSVGSTTDEKGHSKPVRMCLNVNSLLCIDLLFNIQF